MTKEAAIFTFLNGFGIQSFPTDAVPDDAELPYMTYDAQISAFMDGQQTINAHLWYQTESTVDINAKAREISASIGAGGKMIHCDEGAMWITRGAPWCTSGTEENERLIKHRYLNIAVEYMTAD